MHTLPDLNAMVLGTQHSPHAALHNYMKLIYILFCVNDCMRKNAVLFLCKRSKCFPLKPVIIFASYSANAGLDNKGILSRIL